MRAVNLLPEKHRPRARAGGVGNGSYVLLGVLGAIVVAVLLYVLTANSINSAKSEIADARAETANANAKAQALGAYGDFAKVKQQRVEAVKQLAEGRVDWERLVRELAHVLPSRVWVSKVDAADSPANLSSSGGGAPADTSSADASGSGPAVQVQGCAPSQAAVAETLVRFRELEGAQDVKLVESTQPDTSGASTGTGAGNSSTGDGDCGTTHGQPNWQFQVAVSFEAPAGQPYQPGAVPPRLGGGQ